MPSLKHILFVTTANLTTNPRLLKEVIVIGQTYKLKIVVFKLRNWSDRIDQIHQRSLKDAEIHLIPATNSFSWFMASLIQKISSFVIKFIPSSIKFISCLLDKRSLQLWWYLRRKRITVDLVIAHNLGALYPAYKYSKKNNIPFAFDVEDYHPGEGVQYEGQTNISFLRKKIMEKLLPEASYVSFASPLIMKEILKWCPSVKNPKQINNSFFSNEFLVPNQRITEFINQSIKLIWFSQNIAHDRGLELVIESVEHFEVGVFEIHLIGNLYENFYSDWIEPHLDFIRLHKPMNQIDLHRMLSNFDVGLALELSGSDYNRQLCLTNKIFSYTQAGLFVVATDTPAQKMFIDDNPWAGILSGQTVSELTRSLVYISENYEEIKNKTAARFNQAKTLAYENEAKKLADVIEYSIQDV